MSGDEFQIMFKLQRIKRNRGMYVCRSLFWVNSTDIPFIISYIRCWAARLPIKTKKKIVSDCKLDKEETSTETTKESAKVLFVCLF